MNWHTIPNKPTQHRSFNQQLRHDALINYRTEDSAVKRDLLVSIWADACGLVVFRAVHVGTVVKSSVSSPNGPSSALVQKMPIKARKGSVLSTLVLEEQRALLCPELL